MESLAVDVMETSPAPTIIPDDSARSIARGKELESDADELESDDDALSLNFVVNLDEPEDDTEYEPIGAARSGTAWTQSETTLESADPAVEHSQENNEEDSGTMCSTSLTSTDNATTSLLDDVMASLDNSVTREVNTPCAAVVHDDGVPEVAQVEDEGRASPESLPNLNARDSGVGSVISQRLVDSPRDEEDDEAAAPTEEAFGISESLGDLEIHASPDDDDKSSTDYSYYEDIERVDGFLTPSVYLDPQSGTQSRAGQTGGASGGKDKTSIRPILPAFNFDTPSDRKVLARGTLILVGISKPAANHNTLANLSTNALGSETDSGGSVLGYDKDGSMYHIPTDSLKRHGDPTDEPWFYPVEMSPLEATFFLTCEKQKGCFLIYRPVTKPQDVCYILSVCVGGDGLVLHYDIVRNERGDIAVRGHDHSFMTLRELVEYFRKNRSRLATRLRRCLRDARLPISPGCQFARQYEIPRNSVQLNGKILGQGKSCVLCQGVYKSTTVTVKILQKDLTSVEEDDFLEEALVMMALKSHENIVQFIGVSVSLRPFYIVTEFVEKGTLKRCLEADDILSGDVDAHFDICIQMVSALAHLESLRYILHRDLCARNFLLTQDRLVKLSNFERARSVVDDDYHGSESEDLCVQWCAPEVLKTSCYSTKSDVWALGVVFWELFSHGTDPYVRLREDQIVEFVLDGGRLEKPPGCAHDLYEMMNCCWQERPCDRPSFASLSDKIKGKSSIYYATSPSLPCMSPTPVVIEAKSLTLPINVKTPTTARRGTLSSSSSVVNASSQVSTPRISRVDNSLQVTENRREHKRTASSSTYYVASEHVPTSSSDSLTSALTSPSVINVAEKDDLTRGDKIRKSLRKFIKKKTPSAASSHSNSREPVTLIKISSKEH